MYLACGITDMRNGMTGLAMLVQQALADLRFDPRLSLAREITAYQKHRIKRLRRHSRPDPSNTEQSSEILGAAGATLTIMSAANKT